MNAVRDTPSRAGYAACDPTPARGSRSQHTAHTLTHWAGVSVARCWRASAVAEEGLRRSADILPRE